VTVHIDIPEAQWTATFLLMDKLEKLPLDALQGEMREIGLERAVVEDLLASLQVRLCDVMLV
jgi:histidyl-tRNA synthetase